MKIIIAQIHKKKIYFPADFNVKNILLRLVKQKLLYKMWHSTLRGRFNGVSRFLSRSSVFIGDKNLDVYYADKMLAVKYFYGNELTSLLRYKNLYLFRTGKGNATKQNMHVNGFYWLNKFWDLFLPEKLFGSKESFKGR